MSGLIVWGPTPGMLKLMTSETSAVSLADKIACRNDPLPLSAVLLTTMVAPLDGMEFATRNSPAIAVAVWRKLLKCWVFMAITFYPGNCCQNPRDIPARTFSVGFG